MTNARYIDNNVYVLLSEAKHGDTAEEMAVFKIKTSTTFQLALFNTASVPYCEYLYKYFSTKQNAASQMSAHHSNVA